MQAINFVDDIELSLQSLLIASTNVIVVCRPI